MKEVTLPSGKILRIDLAPFADSKALYQAVLEELRTVPMRDEDEIGVNMLKDLFCTGLSSKRVDKALEKCLARCLYDNTKITDEIWEPEEARGDYMKVLLEVAKENIVPFVKSLSAEFSLIRGLLRSDLALRPKTTP